MLKHLEEYGKYVEIAGFRSVKVEDAEAFLKVVRKETPEDTEVQFFDATLVASWQHLYFAVLNALMAFRTERNISKSLAVEVMLYASAQRQISRAIELVGVKKATANVVAVVLGDKSASVEVALGVITKRIGRVSDEKVLELTTEKIQAIKKAFGVSTAELEAASAKDAEQALVNAVIEHMALLSTQL